jgi:hypothetical protein
MRWIQAGRRQGYWLVGPSLTAGIAAQTRLTEKSVLWIVGIWDEDLFRFAFLISPPPNSYVTQHICPIE